MELTEELMKVHGHEDIVAFSDGAHIAAFHARDLEVASVGTPVWQVLGGELEDREIREEILSWQNQSYRIEDERAGDAFQALSINVTQLCNLKCGYCAAGGDGTYGRPARQIDLMPTFAQIDEAFARMRDGGRLHIEYFGGEPLLYPSVIRELSQYTRLRARELGHLASFKIITNGTLLGEEVQEVLRAIRPIVQVSFDGPPELNDLQRVDKTGKGVTDLVVSNVELLAQMRREGSLHALEINAVFDQQNTEVFTAWSFFRQLSVDRYGFEYSVTEGDSEANDRFIEQMSRVARAAYQAGGESELCKIKTFAALFGRLDSGARNQNHCGAGKNYFTIDAANNVFSCPWDVNHPEERLARRVKWDHEKLKFYENQIVEKTDCQSCWARYLCGGGCMYSHKSVTGAKTKVNSAYCKRKRGILAAGILIYSQARNEA